MWSAGSSSIQLVSNVIRFHGKWFILSQMAYLTNIQCILVILTNMVNFHVSHGHVPNGFTFNGFLH